jgi:hypothetical protein
MPREWGLCSLKCPNDPAAKRILLEDRVGQVIILGRGRFGPGGARLARRPFGGRGSDQGSHFA